MRYDVGPLVELNHAEFVYPVPFGCYTLTEVGNNAAPLLSIF